MTPSPDRSPAVGESLTEFPRRNIVPFESKGDLPKLIVMKFGGTSLADVSCIERAVEIVRRAATKTKLVVVVSAMSGVTSKLVEAAELSAAKKRTKAAGIFKEMRERHEVAISGLVDSRSERTALRRKLSKILGDAEQIFGNTRCSYTMAQRHDAIASIGERLCAPIVAETLLSRGVQSEAVDATKLVVTDSMHGAAKPDFGATRARCDEYLRPILHRNVVPVVTGFIGATTNGVTTTLGRNSSDYSATILAAALDADEVVIWTDVDGVLTADPHRVPSATPIPVISYGEAMALAHFGAKVLHPKTLGPLLTACPIPIWIRNTFRSELPGTKVTPGRTSNRVSKALAVMDEVALIRVRYQSIASAREVLDSVVATSGACGEEALSISRESSQREIHIVVPEVASQRVAPTLRHKLMRKIGRSPQSISVDRRAALVTIIGQSISGGSHDLVRVREVLNRAGVKVMAAAQNSSHESVSVVVARKDTNATLIALHREFRMGVPNFVIRGNFERASRRMADPPVPEGAARSCWAAPNVRRWAKMQCYRKVARPWSSGAL